MTDTVFPYSCTSHHSEIATNYDLSVSPSIRGYREYREKNTRVWYTFDQERFEQDILPLNERMSALIRNAQGFDSDMIKSNTSINEKMDLITAINADSEQMIRGIGDVDNKKNIFHPIS